MSLTIIINFIFESATLSYLKVRHIAPNTAIAVTVCYATLRGSIEGAVLGFFAGLVQDIFFGTQIGYYALIYMTIGYICGLPTSKFFKENFYIPMVLCAFCTLLAGVYIYVTSFLMRGKFDFTYFLANIILPETVYTTIFSFFIFRILFSINKRLEQHEYENRKVF